MNSKYAAYLLRWALIQILVGGVGSLIAVTVGAKSTSTFEDLNAFSWQVIFSNMFAWGLGLLALWLATSAIGEYLQESGSPKSLETQKRVGVSSDNPSSSAKKANTYTLTDEQKSQRLSRIEFAKWEEMGRPSLADWDGNTTFSFWASKQN